VTDSTGLYRFTLLDYEPTVSKPHMLGSKKPCANRLSSKLANYDVTESIQVTAESPLLRTGTGSSGATIANQVITELG
jgi:hypothetical protein